MNYHPVSSENQANLHAGQQEANQNAVADFTNLETVVNVSHIPTSRIHSTHPKALNSRRSKLSSSNKKQKYKVTLKSSHLSAIQEIYSTKRENLTHMGHWEINTKRFAKDLENLLRRKLLMLVPDSAKLVTYKSAGAKFVTAIKMLKKNTAKGTNTMAVLDSCPKYNMVAYLEKSEGNAEFHEIIDTLSAFLSSCSPTLHLDAKKKFVMYPRFISIFLDKQLANVSVPLDHFPINTLTSKVFSFMVKKGKHFSGKVTPLFATMFVQPTTSDEGVSLQKEPTEAQPTPSPAPTSEVPHEPQTDSSPAHISEVPFEQQTDPSPRPSPTTTIPDSIPETFGGNLGGHSSSDKSLLGNEGELTLQSVYDLCLSLCAQVSDQAKEIQDLKAQTTKLKKQAKPVIKHHRAYMKSVSAKHRFPRKSFSKKHKVHKESVSKQGRKFAKGESSVQRNPLFDEMPEDTIDHMETENAQSEGRTREMVDEDKEIDERILSTEDVLSTDKEGVSTDFEKVSTDRPIVSTDGSKVSTDRQIEGTEDQVEGAEEQVKGTDEHKEGTEDHNESTEEHNESTEEQREGTEEKVKSTDGQVKGTEDQTEEEIATQTSTQTPTSMIFGDDETIAKVLLNMSQAKAVSKEKEKGIDPKDKGKKKIEEEDESESESDGIPQAEKKFIMYPHFISIFLGKQLVNVPVPLDHFPVNTLTSKVFSFMVKKGKHFSGKVTPLFATMLTDSSPAHTSEVPIEKQTNPSPRPSPSTIILDSIPETSGGNLGGHSSSDKSHSGNEGDMTLQSVYDLCLFLCAHVSDQAKEIKHLKAQIKKKSFSKKQRVHKESVSKQGRKFAKGESSVQRDPLFDEIPEDTVDHMETENAQDVGRTREIVDEDKEIDENILSTEDVLSTDKEAVSTDKEKVSTDRPIVSTDGSKVSTDRQIEGTDEQIESTDEQRKGTEDHTEEGSATQATQTPTSTIFGDDETIAKVLLNMSQAKAVSREKEKGVELKDIEETDIPRPTSTRSLLTLKPLPKIDPKDKGKKKIEEEDESESESDGIPEAEKKFKQLASDEEMARKMQEEWESEEVRNRIAEEKATNEALIRNFDDIKARIEADRLLAEKLQEQEREQFTIEERAKFLHDTIIAQRKFLAQHRSEAIRNRPPTKNQLRN
ncbi:hypothetical protein Tco_0540518 [Tanacetum coccineum]